MTGIVTDRMIWAAANVLIAETSASWADAERIAQRMLLAAGASDPNPHPSADVRAVDEWADGFLAGERSLFGGE
jgi:hypothetical protein